MLAMATKKIKYSCDFIGGKRKLWSGEHFRVFFQYRTGDIGHHKFMVDCKEQERFVSGR